jgi:hypothetical protein
MAMQEINISLESTEEQKQAADVGGGVKAIRNGGSKIGSP